jgi:AcrR family transcriptional regulator
MTKKEKIEHTARELFWKHGFKKLSVDEISKKAHDSRKTYYTYYSNKNAIVLSILEALSNDMLEKYEVLMNDENKSFSEKIKEMMHLKSETNKQFSMEFVADLYGSEMPEIMDYFKSMSVKSLQITRAFFEKAQQKEEMNPNLDINFVMWYMQKQSELVNSPDLKLMFPDIKKLTVQFSELLIYGIMPVGK